ncbi:hypothetical protein HPB51_025318 [Rhipicephalus microplus]|uniref:Peptidase M13 C-terminal domain-containing protein n=1 Tax=Rhipicephalus microplus TaxID=6941 RepID=A0A9J6F8H9_RHIMP|nr:hypothetical protein HPB51_025318 [Rhipicephalus microplus]
MGRWGRARMRDKSRGRFSNEPRSHVFDPGQMYTRHLRERGIKGNFVLANLPNVTAQQLFYTSYAMGFCENSNEGYPQRHVKTSTVALTHHRVNIPLANSDGFGDAFRCLRGTPMNPHVKCKFWRFQ